jgi:hypothetical protein
MPPFTVRSEILQPPAPIIPETPRPTAELFDVTGSCDEKSPFKLSAFSAA